VQLSLAQKESEAASRIGIEKLLPRKVELHQLCVSSFTRIM
jgi:hypothetical protein